MFKELHLPRVAEKNWLFHGLKLYCRYQLGADGEAVIARKPHYLMGNEQKVAVK